MVYGKYIHTCGALWRCFQSLAMITHREVQCAALLGVLHSVGIVVLAHVHNFVAQLLYLPYRALVHAHMLNCMSNLRPTHSPMWSPMMLGFVPSSASSSCAVVAAGGLSSAPSKCTCAIALHCITVS